MADNGDYDPCECVEMFTQQARMQRLLAMLRNSQSYCTDTECFNERPDSEDIDQMHLWTLFLGFAFLAFMLYFVRFSSMINGRTSSKPRSSRDGNGPGDNGEAFL